MRYKKRIVIIGKGSNSSIMSYLFNHYDSSTIVGYSVDREYIEEEDKETIPLDILEQYHDPVGENNFVFVAIGNNEIRERIYKDLKERSYKFASFISDYAVVYANVLLGENVFIFENNVIQYKSVIGNNTIIWSGNHIGHESVIGNNVFISSHCVISGFCNIGDNCFLGVNCTIADNTIIPPGYFVKAGSLVYNDKNGDLICGKS